MAFSLALGVTPERLKAKAEDVSAAIESMRNEVQAIQSELEYTGSYWLGEAGNLHRKKFEDNISEINFLFSRLDTYPTRILQMAGIYEEAESRNTATAGSLGTDFVMQ